MIRRLVAFVAAAFPLLANGETGITWFLATAEKDFTVVEQEKKIAVISQGAPSIPFVNNIEFRLRNKAFEPDRQRYSLRVEPRGIGETRATERLFNAQVARETQQREFLENDALRDRYMLVIESLERRVRLQMYGEMIVLYEDRTKVLHKTSYSTDFDISSVITAENELTKLRTLGIETAKEIEVLRREIRFRLGDTAFTDFDTTGLLPISTVSDRLAAMPLAIDTNNVYLSHYRLQFRLAEERYSLEKAASRRFVSLLSFSYDNGTMLDEIARRDDGKSFNLNHSYLLEAGIRLPFLTADRQEIARRKAAYLSDKADYERLKRELLDKMLHDREDILALIAEFRYVTARENEVDAQTSLKKYLQMSGADPLMLLSIKEAILKNRMETEKIRFDILRNYVRVLDATGALSRTPLKNYLSGSSETIVP
jgi:hypothetical protein